MIHQEGHHPGDYALAEGHACGLPAGVQLPFHRGDGGHAGGVQQGEHQEAQGADGGEQRAQGRHRDLGAGAGEDTQGGDDGFLGDKSGDEGAGCRRCR